MGEGGGGGRCGAGGGLRMWMSWYKGFPCWGGGWVVDVVPWGSSYVDTMVHGVFVLEQGIS